MAVVLLLARLCCACQAAPVVDLKLIFTPQLGDGSELAQVSLQIVDAETGERAAETSFAGDALDSTRDLLDLGALSEGKRYRAQVSATVAGDSSACSGRHKAVGRSLPFTHRAGGYTITLQVGCADEFELTRGAPHYARLGHDVVTSFAADGGDTLVIGGAKGLDLADLDADRLPSLIDPVPEIERYDPASGRFEDAGTLMAERALAATLALPDGRIAVFGGIVPDKGCSNSYEIVWPKSETDNGRLQVARCVPSAVRLKDSVALLGGAFGRDDADAELFKGGLTSNKSLLVDGASATRSGPIVVPLGAGTLALAIGGNKSGPAVELFRTDCSKGPCFSAIDIEAGPAANWDRGAAAYVPCARGGGAVYITGGAIPTVNPANGDPVSIAQDDVWCFLDRPNGGKLIAAGKLPAARSDHLSLAVDGPDGNARLLLIGGTSDTATLAELDACSCGPIKHSRDTILPGNAYPILQRATRLADGSVLLVGGIDLSTLAKDVPTARAYAALLFPDWGEP